jgi:hypothetical protein
MELLSPAAVRITRGCLASWREVCDFLSRLLAITCNLKEESPYKKVPAKFHEPSNNMHYHLIVLSSMLAMLQTRPRQPTDVGIRPQDWLSSEAVVLACESSVEYAQFSPSTKSPVMIQIIQFCFCKIIEENQLPYQSISDRGQSFFEPVFKLNN